jgi:hypothetical protein
MKQLFGFITAMLMSAILLSCSGSKPKGEMPKAIENPTVVVGAVLVENDGIDDRFESITANITVVLVRKFLLDGKEESKGYRIKTDRNGYFRLENVPAGSSVLKGIELDLGYANRMLITSIWEGDSQMYTTGGRMIDFNVRVWPPSNAGPVTDMGIRYFRIDRSGRISHNQFQSLNGASLGLKDKAYTMKNPKSYYVK